ncbi:type IV pilus biogenesis protein PilP [Photorhabdus noenieputensis]|uniref:type IV pilus biogenesis protein PilP n=1 Tax=Photorhabdus noenieputensis TaxID=1208607 RepID=UPI000D471B4E|nr:type IV pilus biogenesis protein PilP [Photorhabdus noenieputensis]MBS9439599.1 type IV pilus biogenesis protein PilP [Photorhabdus noenieputensis]MCK3668881.1 type IV pilus biogenesis protein PilP [Photorhabdus noenieputensis]PQQ35628.1 type IV pilus biogenesis protein PilP [Photorhabdus luminescens]
MPGNNTALCISVLSGLIFISSPVWATEDSALSVTGMTEASAGVTVGQLEHLHAKNLLLEAELQRAKLQRQLTESQPLGLTGSNDIGLPVTVSPVITAGQPVTRPVVQEIYGRGKALRASVSLPGRGVMELAVGDAVPGTQFKVKVITLSAVTLSDGSVLTF